MASAVTFVAGSDFGFSGQYVARITGRDSKYTFTRQWVGSKTGKRDERTEAMVDEAGLYEVRNVTKKSKEDSFFFVCAVADGEVVKIRTDREDAMKVAKEIGSGRGFSDIVHPSQEDGQWVYEILTKKEAQAQAVTNVVEQAYLLLAVLDRAARKAALATLKKRLTDGTTATGADAVDSEASS